MADRVDPKVALGLENKWNTCQTANPLTNTDPFPCVDESVTHLHNDLGPEIRQFALALRRRRAVGGVFQRSRLFARCRIEGKIGTAAVAVENGLTATWSNASRMDTDSDVQSLASTSDAVRGFRAWVVCSRLNGTILPNICNLPTP